MWLTAISSKRLQTIWLLLAVTTWPTSVRSFSRGPPITTCLTQFPKHDDAEVQGTPSPFKVVVTPGNYTPLQNITVRLVADSGRSFRGFQVSAHPQQGNTELIIGQFLEWPTNKAQVYSCLSGENNMVVHKDNTEVTSVELKWQAPKIPVGGIVFITTFVENKHTFWYDVQGLLMPADGAAIDPSFPTVESVSSVFEDIDFTKCRNTKGCLLYPRTCSGADCQAALTYRQQESLFHFEMFATAEGWVSVGFSKDRLMGNDETVSCTAQNERVTVQHGYNPERSNDRQYRGKLTGVQVRQADGKISCRFTRPRQASISVYNRTALRVVENKTFDFEEEWYLFLAWGYTFRDTDVMKYHDELPVVTESMVKFNHSIIVRGTVLPYATQAHGAMMVLSWVLFAGITTVISRYYRSLLPKHTLAGTKVWFQVHRSLSLAAACLTVIGMIVVFVYVGKLSKAVAHTWVGIVVVVGAVFMALSGLLRPGLDSHWRPVFNWSHRLLGATIFTLAAINLILAFRIELLSVSQKYFGTVVFAYWLVMEVAWFIIFEVRMYYKKTKTRHEFITDDSNKLHVQETTSHHDVTDNILLPLYVLSVVGIAIAGLCAIFLF